MWLLTHEAIIINLLHFTDAAVMGGTENYEKAFMTDKYLNEHPEDAEKVDDLRYQLAYQIPLLDIGLK